MEDAIATGAFNPGELHENGVIDAVVEDARAWYGPQWDADKLAEKGVESQGGRVGQARHLVDGHAQAFVVAAGLTPVRLAVCLRQS